MGRRGAFKFAQEDRTEITSRTAAAQVSQLHVVNVRQVLTRRERDDREKVAAKERREKMRPDPVLPLIDKLESY